MMQNGPSILRSSSEAVSELFEPISKSNIKSFLRPPLAPPPHIWNSDPDCPLDTGLCTKAGKPEFLDYINGAEESERAPTGGNRSFGLANNLVPEVPHVTSMTVDLDC
jgi:hypothetical protein